MSLVLDAFAGSWDHGIMGSYDFVPSQRLFHETDSRPITSIVSQRQLWLYGHVARYPEADPAFRVGSERDNPTWRRSRGRPQNSRLWQVDVFCWESLGMGRDPTWRLGRRDRQGWHRKVGEALRPSAYAPPTVAK